MTSMLKVWVSVISVSSPRVINSCSSFIVCHTHFIWASPPSLVLQRVKEKKGNCFGFKVGLTVVWSPLCN